MNKLLLSLAIGVSSFALAPAVGYAQPIVLHNATPAYWQLVPGAGATWVLPATIPGCGSENGTTCEPTGIWYGNTAWSGVPSKITMTENTGGPSDVILFDSGGPNGDFRVRFYSDPNPGAFGGWPGYALYANYNETFSAGAVSGPQPICCQLTGVNVNVASDGEVAFDPFGAGFDTSDGIQFTGNVVVGSNVPEPATWAMMLLGFAGLGFAGYRARKQTAALGV
ncbi:MAG: PEPxxWA-CTERM sorting domain-containing protein [Hyphomicrobiales bacterium]|nr:PEPxxWA-CTERM sorting domain-containing protein [Hyphomicrobiales bacterium]